MMRNAAPQAMLISRIPSESSIIQTAKAMFPMIVKVLGNSMVSLI